MTDRREVEARALRSDMVAGVLRWSELPAENREPWLQLADKVLARRDAFMLALLRVVVAAAADRVEAFGFAPSVPPNGLPRVTGVEQNVLKAAAADLRAQMPVALFMGQVITDEENKARRTGVNE